jgi:hypothetical protein
MPLTFANSLSTRANVVFIFKMLSYVSLVVFFLSTLHKMIGVEYIVTCQMMYFSFVFY